MTHYTTWKRRGTKEVKSCIDYIFHSPSLATAARLEPPEEAELESSRLPGFRYPSDHLAIMAHLVAAWRSS